MSLLKDEMIPYLTQKEIKDLVKRLARQIELEYNNNEITLICCLKGSIPFCADLMRELKMPQRVDFVKLTSAYDPSNEETVVHINKDISLDITNKHVLIVEEIIENARTLSFLKQRLLLANPASLRIVTLLDKPARRVAPLKPDFVGKIIEDRYVVGYGMDEEELGRNYSEIYYLRH